MRRAYTVHVMLTGAPIRSITVVIIAMTVEFLAFFGRLTHEVTIVLSGISGYVLGAMAHAKDIPVGWKRPSEAEGSSKSKGKADEGLNPI